jgi:poly(3-hydroxyalkanoate) synthetase
MTKPSAQPPDSATASEALPSASAPGGQAAAGQAMAAVPFAWPFVMACSMGHATAAMLKWYGGILAGATEAAAEPPPAPDWATPNRVTLELPAMRLRDFSSGDGGPAALICAPYALHGASIADFAPGHSIAAALRSAVPRVFLTEWRSAEPAMRYFSIDSYLADLAIAVEEIGPPVDLVGLCQGGWLALVFAARFPNKVRRLVLAGAPVDVRAAESALMRTVDELPFSAFENLVRLGEGRVLGQYALKLWGSESAAKEPESVLQLPHAESAERLDELKRRFERWYAWTVDLPGTYYLEVVQWLFKDNEIAAGRFIALGRRIDLRTLRVPLYLLAAEDDEVIAPEQLFAAMRLVSTPKEHIETRTVTCGHLGLFMGAQTIAGPWREIARWLASDLDMALAS